MGERWMQGQQTFTAVAHVVVFLFLTAATLRVQDECGPLLQLLFAAVEFDEYTAGLLMATHFIFLSAHAGISAVYVQPSGLQDSRSWLVMVPASFSRTCGHWVGYGPCVISGPQPAATERGSGSHPSQCIYPRGALMRVFSFVGRWCCCLAAFLWLQVWRARPLFHFP